MMDELTILYGDDKKSIKVAINNYKKNMNTSSNISTHDNSE